MLRSRSCVGALLLTLSAPVQRLCWPFGLRVWHVELAARNLEELRCNT